MIAHSAAMLRPFRSRAVATAAALLLLGAGAGARADTLAVHSSAGGAAHKAAEYRGVEPGQARTPPPTHWRGRYPPVTWIGFQERPDGSSRVFVQLVRGTTYKQAVVGGALWVTVSGVDFGSRNTARPLDVRFFQTALARITPRRTHRRRATAKRPALPNGVALVITFKHRGAARPAEASLRKAKDGYYYLYLDFPAGGEEQASHK